MVQHLMFGVQHLMFGVGPLDPDRRLATMRIVRGDSHDSPCLIDRIKAV